MKRLFLVMLALILMGVSVEGTGSNAANSGDTDWKFTFLATQVEFKKTAKRTKEDASSVYVKGEGFTGSIKKVYVRAFGVDSNNTFRNRTYNNRNYYYTRNNVGYLVYNEVHESGDTYASLGVLNVSGQSGTAEGVWSPDTVNESAYSQMPY